MNAVRALKALGPIDARNVGRDPLLRWMVPFPLGLALVLRWGAPALASWLRERHGFDLAATYPLLMSCVVQMMPILAGVVVGFLLLDQSDDRTLAALQVTPLPLNGYLAYRLALPTLLGLAATLVAFPLAGLVEARPLPLALASLAAAPLAPLFALFLAAFAENKVQGFALMKAAGILFFPPIVAYFVRGSWQLAFGVIPTYWPAKVFWTAQAGEPVAWLHLAVGLAYQGLLLAALLRRFARVMHR